MNESDITDEELSGKTEKEIDQFFDFQWDENKSIDSNLLEFNAAKDRFEKICIRWLTINHQFKNDVPIGLAHRAYECFLKNKLRKLCHSVTPYIPYHIS